MFEELQANCIPPPPRKRTANSWILEATWKLVDHCAMLWHRGMIGLSVARKMGRQIKASLKSDRKNTAATAASSIKGHLAYGDLKKTHGDY